MSSFFKHENVISTPSPVHEPVMQVGASINTSSFREQHITICVVLQKKPQQFCLLQQPCDYNWGSQSSQMRSILPFKTFSEQHTESFATQELTKTTVDLLFPVLSPLFFLSWRFYKLSDVPWFPVCRLSGSIQKHLVCSFKSMLILLI